MGRSPPRAASTPALVRGTGESDSAAGDGTAVDAAAGGSPPPEEDLEPGASFCRVHHEQSVMHVQCLDAQEIASLRHRQASTRAFSISSTIRSTVLKKAHLDRHLSSDCQSHVVIQSYRPRHMTRIMKTHADKHATRCWCGRAETADMIGTSGRSDR